MESEISIDGELHRLRKGINDVQDLVEPLIEKTRYNALDDDMRSMVFCFMNKQMEHIKSICLLVDNYQYRDAWAISRIMFEGLWLLLWAHQDPTHNRAHNWKSYWWVGEFRRMYDKPGYSRENLETYCNQFLKSKAKNKNNTDIIPDDYRKQWTIESEEQSKNPKYIPLKDIINNMVKHEPLYYQAYTMTSGWLHWDSYIIGQALKYDDGCVDYANETKWIGQLAYLNGYRSLLWSAKIFTDVFKIKLDNLQKLIDMNVDEDITQKM